GNLPLAGRCAPSKSASPRWKAEAGEHVPNVPEPERDRIDPALAEPESYADTPASGDKGQNSQPPREAADSFHRQSIEGHTCAWCRPHLAEEWRILLSWCGFRELLHALYRLLWRRRGGGTRLTTEHPGHHRQQDGTQYGSGKHFHGDSSPLRKGNKKEKIEVRIESEPSRAGVSGQPEKFLSREAIFTNQGSV